MRSIGERVFSCFGVIKALVRSQLLFNCKYTIANMQDDENNIVDIYIPRKCSATNRLITAKDHASVQIEIAGVSNLFQIY